MTALPPGFVLEEDLKAQPQGLPPGFVLEEPNQDKNIIDRLSDDFGKRRDMVNEIRDAKNRGEIGQLQGTYQVAGKGIAGFGNDILAELIQSADQSIPDKYKMAFPVLGPAYVAGKKVMQSQPVQNTVKAGSDLYGGFAKEHPNAARNIEATANLASFGIPTGKGRVVLNEVVDTGAAAVKAPIKAAGVVGKAALPRIDEGLRDTAAIARRYNIPLSFDQITDSRAVKTAQKVSQELPFSGQAGFREKQISAWNKALLNTVGLDADKFTKLNMDKAFMNVGREFDKLGEGKTFQFDDNFTRGLDEIRQEAMATSNRDAIENFNNVVEKIVLPEADASGVISGEKLSKLRSRVNALARKSNNPDTQEILHDLENSIIDVMTAGDDVAKGQLSAAKQKYKNLIVLEPLAAKAKGGNISPSLLNNRVAKVYGRSHVRGQAGPIGDLAQVGHEILPELGGSDTAQKLLTVGAVTSSLANPATVPVIAGGLVGNRVLQSGLNRNQKLIDAAIKRKK